MAIFTVIFLPALVHSLLNLDMFILTVLVIQTIAFSHGYTTDRMSVIISVITMEMGGKRCMYKRQLRV